MQQFTPAHISLLKKIFAESGDGMIPGTWLTDASVPYAKLIEAELFAGLDPRYVRLVTPSGTYINFDGTTNNDVVLGHLAGTGLVLGDLSAGNYTVIEADGTLVSVGDAATWDDLRFPSQGINPPGLASDPTVNTTNGLLDFSNLVTNLLAGVAQMPHAWKLETAICPHIHWFGFTAPGATPQVVWRLEAEVVPIGGSWDGATYSYDESITEDVTEDVHLLSEFPEIDMTGVTSVSANIFWRLSRLGGDAADNYGAVATLSEFDIHYQIDTMGSRTEYTK